MRRWGWGVEGEWGEEEEQGVLGLGEGLVALGLGELGEKGGLGWVEVLGDLG